MWTPPSGVCFWLDDSVPLFSSFGMLSSKCNSRPQVPGDFNNPGQHIGIAYLNFYDESTGECVASGLKFDWVVDEVSQMTAVRVFRYLQVVPCAMAADASYNRVQRVDCVLTEHPSTSVVTRGSVPRGSVPLVVTHF